MPNSYLYALMNNILTHFSSSPVHIIRLFAWLILFSQSHQFSKINCYFKFFSVLLWTECLILHPPIHMLKSNSQYDSIWKWGIWEVIRSWEHSLNEWDLCFYKKRTENLFSITWEYSKVWQSVTSESNNTGTLILDFQPPELWYIHFGCLKATQTVVLCYNNPN